jgi:galactokinase
MSMSDCNWTDTFFETELLLSHQRTKFGETGMIMCTRSWYLRTFTEANRVKAFREVCQKEMEASIACKKLGELMRESHQSLQKLYECSHPNLDKLVELSEGKALGSRLTGAGWVLQYC